MLLLPLAAGASSAVHERKEVAGMMVVFGAEPEPAITGERQELVPGPAAPLAGNAATEVIEAFHAAVAVGDGDQALAYLAPEVVIFESGNAEMSRDEYASHHLGGDMRFAGATQRETIDQRYEIVGDMAFVLTQSRTTGSFSGRQIDSTGVETMVLRRVGGRWLIVHIHWS